MNEKLWWILIIVSLSMVFGSSIYGAITHDMTGFVALIFTGLIMFGLLCAFASDDAGAN